MNYEILVANSAKKNLMRYPLKDRERIENAISDMIANPYFGDIKRMEGDANTWRRRVGSYRIFYHLYFDQKIIKIYSIERRTSKTY